MILIRENPSLDLNITDTHGRKRLGKIAAATEPASVRNRSTASL
jgi:hypothetical protein